MVFGQVFYRRKGKQKSTPYSYLHLPRSYMTTRSKRSVGSTASPSNLILSGYNIRQLCYYLIITTDSKYPSYGMLRYPLQISFLKSRPRTIGPDRPSIKKTLSRLGLLVRWTVRTGSPGIWGRTIGSPVYICLGPTAFEHLYSLY